MTRVLPRTNFHSSKLIRCLADLALAEAGDAGNAFAEQLGQWVHFADAIALSAVHGDTAAGLPKTLPKSQQGQAARKEYERILTQLTDSVIQSCSSKVGRSHIRLPEPQLELPLDPNAASLPYRRFYEAHQRDMELTIQPLRVNLRAAMAKASPRLRKLAELDAVLEKVLRERESKLLAKVPMLLRKRFEQLFKEHQRRLADAGQADNPAHWTRPEAWLARFCKDMQMLLLAEVELRLHPALGLIEAINQDTQ